MEHKVRDCRDNSAVSLVAQDRSNSRVQLCYPQQAPAVPSAQLLITIYHRCFCFLPSWSQRGAALSAFFCLTANAFFVELGKTKWPALGWGKFLTDTTVMTTIFFCPCSCCGNGPLKIASNTCGDPLKMMSKSWGTNASLATGEDRAENLHFLEINLMMSRGR